MRSASPSRRSAGAVGFSALLGLVGGCGEPSFVAMQTDFVGFEGWERFDVVDDGSNLGHTTGPRRVWLNYRPGPHDDAFPVGTLIVKAAGEGDDPTAWSVVARAKRGGDYNAEGAVGWEWFGLTLDEGGVPAVAWRGTDGDGYRGGVGEDDTDDTDEPPVRGSCNGCHRAAYDNDTVSTPALALDLLR
jgi:hypothetical protein